MAPRIALGMLGGAGLIALMLSEAPEVRFGFVAGIIGLVAAGMAVASAVACIVPTRRALAVRPMDALRND